MRTTKHDKNDSEDVSRKVAKVEQARGECRGRFRVVLSGFSFAPLRLCVSNCILRNCSALSNRFRHCGARDLALLARHCAFVIKKEPRLHPFTPP